MVKKNRVFALLFLLLFVLTGCSDDDNQVKKTSMEAEQIVEKAEEAEEVESSFEVHYLNVGQADATLIMCDGENMLIDGGNVEDSSLIYSYLEEHEVEYIDYMICTHAHEDHVGGLAGALNYAEAGVVYAPVKEFDTDAFEDFKKYVEKQGNEITVPTADTEFKLGSAECTVLGANVVNDDNPNNTSIVLKVEYGDTQFLFSGDAEQIVEKNIIESGYNIECTVMKVPHHGSETSLSYRWLNEAMPEYAVISVGDNNSYGHPNKDTLSKLRDAEVTVFRTDMQGHIICRSDGEEVEFDIQKNKETDTLAETGEGKNTAVTVGEYILNTNTEKFHYPDCHSVDDMKEKNKQETNLTREELIEQGYSPCGNCNP